MLSHPSGLFQDTTFRPLRGAAPSNFYTPYNSRNCIFSRTWGAGRPQVGLYPIFLVLSVDQSVCVLCISVTCRRTGESALKTRKTNVQPFIHHDTTNSLLFMMPNYSAGVACVARVYMWTSHRIELEKSDVQLFCRADGNPLPTITWLDRNGVVAKNDTKQYQVLLTQILQLSVI